MKKLVILFAAATFAFGIQSCTNTSKKVDETPVVEVIEEVIEEEVIEEADSTAVEEVMEQGEGALNEEAGE